MTRNAAAQFVMKHSQQSLISIIFRPIGLGGSNDWTALEAYRRSTILRNRCRNRSPGRRQQFYG